MVHKTHRKTPETEVGQTPEFILPALQAEDEVGTSDEKSRRDASGLGEAHRLYGSSRAGHFVARHETGGRLFLLTDVAAIAGD